MPILCITAGLKKLWGQTSGKQMLSDSFLPLLISAIGPRVAYLAHREEDRLFYHAANKS